MQSTKVPTCKRLDDVLNCFLYFCSKIINFLVSNLFYFSAQLLVIRDLISSVSSALIAASPHVYAFA